MGGENMTEEELLAKDIEESLNESNIGENKLQTVPTEQSVALQNQFRGIDIEGLEGIPASMVAIPYCRVIQPTSKKTTLKDGSEATPGYFMFNDVQEQVQELHFTMLRAKMDMSFVDKDGNYVTNDYEGEKRQKQLLKLLGITLDTDKLFILSLTSTSFSSWGRLLAQMKAIKLDKTYRFSLKATTEKKENKKGKYYTVNFALGEEVGEEKLQELSKIAFEYGVVLDKQIVETEE